MQPELYPRVVLVLSTSREPKTGFRPVIPGTLRQYNIRIRHEERYQTRHQLQHILIGATMKSVLCVLAVLAVVSGGPPPYYRPVYSRNGVRSYANQYGRSQSQGARYNTYSSQSNYGQYSSQPQDDVFDASGSDPRNQIRLVNKNPGGGASGPLGLNVGPCSASLICIPEYQCNPYTGYVYGGLRFEPKGPSNRPTVALLRCNQLKDGGYGEGVCCQLPHLDDPWPRKQ